MVQVSGRTVAAPRRTTSQGDVDPASLKARLERKQQEEAENILVATGADLIGMVGSGDREEKIRTYNFPQNRVTDHRINFTSHQIDAILGGDIQPLIEELTSHYETERLKQELSAEAV